MGEVYDAVSASTDNGYDEEYMMCDLFTVPGAGVGSAALASKAGFAGADTKGYDRPLRDLIREGLEARAMTKAPMMTVDEYLDALESSDIQIYWPYSEEWDGKTFPVITFDPNDGSETNVGWKMNAEGLLVEVLVDEELARERPVWVINRNDDSGHKTLEMLRKSDPDWGQGGGTIIIGRPENAPRAVPAE